MDNLNHLIEGFGSALTPTNLLFACVSAQPATLATMMPRLTSTVCAVMVPSIRAAITTAMAGMRMASNTDWRKK